MDTEPYCYGKLPFSELFKTYTSNYNKLDSYFTYNPFNPGSVKKRRDSLKIPSRLARFLPALNEYHRQLGISQQAQLEKLSQQGACAVITGQQLTIYGGPLYTVYKTISAILLARQAEQALGVPVVPVFWLADEDHDFEEVSGFGIPGNDEFTSVNYEQKNTGRPVSDYRLSAESLKAFDEQVWHELGETDFSDKLKQLVHSGYAGGASFAAAFAKLMDALFGRHGLLIAGSNTKEIKAIAAETLQDAVLKNQAVNHALEKQSAALEKDGFHRQVVLGSTNLFYYDTNGVRTKIEYENGSWTASDKKWNTETLVREIKERPEAFSPNVFLRPVIQDKLLPGLGYVGGPGETAYYAQMKEMYPVFDMEMPVIFPRLSMTLLETGTERAMERLPFSFEKYNSRIEDLISEYVALSDNHDIEAVFSAWKSRLAEISEAPAALIQEIDGSLAGTAGKTLAGFESGIDALKGRVYRSLKQQEQVQLNRIRRVKAQLFPGDGLQERTVSFLYFMNKYGADIWDELLEAFSEKPADLTKHYIVRL